MKYTLTLALCTPLLNFCAAPPTAPQTATTSTTATIAPPTLTNVSANNHPMIIPHFDLDNMRGTHRENNRKLRKIILQQRQAIAQLTKRIAELEEALLYAKSGKAFIKRYTQVKRSMYLGAHGATPTTASTASTSTPSFEAKTIELGCPVNY